MDELAHGGLGLDAGPGIISKGLPGTWTPESALSFFQTCKLYGTPLLPTSIALAIPLALVLLATFKRYKKITRTRLRSWRSLRNYEIWCTKTSSRARPYTFLLNQQNAHRHSNACSPTSGPPHLLLLNTAPGFSSRTAKSAKNTWTSSANVLPSSSPSRHRTTSPPPSLLILLPQTTLKPAYGLSQPQRSRKSAPASSN
jgi:hypothetical protein